MTVPAAIRSRKNSEKDAIWQEGFEDPVFFFRFFLENWFPDTVPWFHRGILAILTRKTAFLEKYGELDKIIRHFVWKVNPDDPKSEEHAIFYLDKEGHICLRVTPFTSIMLPRGFSKTTLLNGVVLYWIHYEERKFPVYLSESGPHAEMQLANVKSELEANTLFHSIFGKLVPDRNSSNKWTATFIETTNGVTVAVRGRGAQVRGLNHKGQRPDVIIPDDIEDKESVLTELQREKVRNWFYADVLPALPPRDPDAAIIALGTLLHRDSLLKTMEKDPRFTSIEFGAIDRDGEALWPEHRSLKDLEKMKESYAAVGQLAAFNMEYFSTLRDEETAKFKSHYIIIEPLPTETLTSGEVVPVPLHKALIIDPAISDKPGSDFCALYVVGMSEKGLIYVLDEYQKVGMTPRDQIDKYFEFFQKWKPERCGVEAISYQAALVHLLREEMFRRHTYFEIEPIKHKVKKVERVEGILQPRYAAGYIRHIRHFPSLESQLLDWPSGKMDGPDALAMAIALLDPYAAQAADPDKDMTEDEYEPLMQIDAGI